ncbi:DUF6455 family protein [Tropicimonas sp. TH_r6]|uniref:DUF6455 family protein n=1 Tax=Tropicimonas sp. TH_r6 TaxID=3082085 RepID=UPI00295342EC|nr:DUF6455 family protein [Tropicimonas sp. TH_r6]MDV7142441.1 DUF6455 family protein [Tropicimonas sp. TH_r6]
MKPLGPQRDHYWLALSMAKAAGVDLQAAIDEGRFSQTKWAETVHRCRGCDWGGDCPHWLHENPEAEAAPENCVNAKLFAALKATQETGRLSEQKQS